MWSNINGWPDKRKEFVVNHFVPIFQQHHPTLPLNNQLKAEMDGEWHEVKLRKLQSKTQEKWKCSGGKQSSTKLFQGKVAEREVQDEFIKSENKKENRVYSNTESLELRGSKKQGGHGNVMATENEKKKDTENIKPETDQDTTHTSTTRFGKKTVNKGYELKPENSGTSKQNKRKLSERKQSSSPLEKIQKVQHVQWPENNKNRKSTKLETKKSKETRPRLKGTRKVLGRSEVNRNTKLFVNIKRLTKMRSMKLKSKSNSARRKIIKSILTS